MNKKPRLFIGSSVESLEIADAVNLNLDHQFEVTIWRNGTFDLSSNTIDSIVKKSQSVDFALFIFSPDDISIIRDQQKAIVRDNVLFELGIFIGAIGKERCFILRPRGVDLHFPTDLLGIIPADFEPNRTDGDLTSAVNNACVLIKNKMKSLKSLANLPRFHLPQKVSVNANLQLSSQDFETLSQFIQTVTTNPDGNSLDYIKNNMNNNSLRIDLSVIKLEKLGYLEKRNATDHNGWEYFAYTITNEGVDLLLENEEKIPGVVVPPSNDVPF